MNEIDSAEKFSKFLKPYDPKVTEGFIYKRWEESGFFNPDNLPVPDGEQLKINPSAGKPFTIMIAPPNITGSLHMGHALENTISDILIRMHRMRGLKTLWVPGTDHAGIATQNVVEKDLKKQGLTRHDLGREKFLEKIWEWREKHGGIIEGQLKRLGCSLDWSRARFTMDERYQRAVKTAFEHYQKKGLVYQGERVINWCIKDQTALSDLELEYAEEKSKLWFIKYPVKGAENAGGADKKFITVATTRPETMLGDTAVAVNPKDERYKDLVGKIVLLPIVNREIPIIADHAIEMEFGTGAVKVTPAHDITDSDIASRHNLPFIKVINEVGKIAIAAGNAAGTGGVSAGAAEKFNGMKIAEAREKVVVDLTALGLIEKTEELTHNVAKCYRCGSTVEPLLSKQWFLKMKPLAERAIAAIKNDDVHYVPERWQAIALDWLTNVRDWCVSRQIWWGHTIPAVDPATGKPSTDTFDTWFSSALWPFAALGWPDAIDKKGQLTGDLRQFYPTSVITSARDILHLWISRMLFNGLEFMDGKAPFSDIIIHATVLTKDGKRMSKSLGTGVDPLDLIEKYGADALRFGLIYQAFEGQELRFNEDVLAMGRKFSNKLWNISRFVLTQTDGDICTSRQELEKSNMTEKQFLAKLDETVKRVTASIQGYTFGEAAHALYDFIWHDFADVYIEQSKTKISDPKTDPRAAAECKLVLGYTLATILKLLHPFMPFITEEIWQTIGATGTTGAGEKGGEKAGESSAKDTHSLLMIESWPAVK